MNDENDTGIGDLSRAILNDVISPLLLTGSFLNSVANTCPSAFLAHLGTNASTGKGLGPDLI